MVKKRILKKIAQGNLTPYAAYELLYQKKLRRARFIKIHMSVSEHPWLSAFINTLFFLAFPIAWGEKILMRMINKKGLNIDYLTFKNLLDYSSGTEIDVLTEEAKVQIFIF
ncbi:MAG: hypothetical protein BWY97_01236 [Tenericutes bacterium ADurb.BinA124]|nr:MAG: hypothetical protein BWY97_01236 [Tenericutes bacterium ADurb.BinA124]